MYNILHGKNPDSDVLLLMLGNPNVGRFRDAWITAEGEIAIYTRNGGGNRECWCNEAGDGLDFDAGGTLEPKPDQKHGEFCTWVANDRMRKSPLYLRDEDDPGDETYATFYFKVPPEFKTKADQLASTQSTEFSKSPAQRFNELLAEIKKMTPEQLETEFPEITGAMKKIAEKLGGEAH